MRKSYFKYHADDGCLFVLTAAGYEKTPDDVRRERAIGYPVPMHGYEVFHSWVDNGWVEEIRVALTDSERREIAGRFCLFDRTEDAVVVGCVGSLWAHDLSKTQIHYIRNFYHAKGEAVVMQDAGAGRLPKGNFNNFLVFKNSKGE